MCNVHHIFFEKSSVGVWSVLNRGGGVFVLKKSNNQRMLKMRKVPTLKCTVHFVKENVTDLSKKAERSCGLIEKIIPTQNHQ